MFTGSPNIPEASKAGFPLKSHALLSQSRSQRQNPTQNPLPIGSQGPVGPYSH